MTAPGVPVMKCEIGVAFALPLMNYIRFWATPDAASDLRQFGILTQAEEASALYTLEVDARFDFAEVIAYLQAYGKEDGK